MEELGIGLIIVIVLAGLIGLAFLSLLAKGMSR